MSLNQCETLQNRIENVIDLYREDPEVSRMSSSEVIGVLEMIKFNVIQDSIEEDEELI